MQMAAGYNTALQTLGAGGGVAAPGGKLPGVNPAPSAKGKTNKTPPAEPLPLCEARPCRSTLSPRFR